MVEHFNLRYSKKQKKWYVIEEGYFHHQVLQSYDTKKEALNAVEKLAERDNELKIVAVYNMDGVQIRTEKFKP